MQRVSAFLPSWDKRNSATKPGSLFGWANRHSTPAAPGTGAPRLPSRINIALANADAAGPRVRREAFWPAPLDSECDKAARILKSFCADGYLAPARAEPAPPAPPPPAGDVPDAAVHKIPRRVIQNAAGIAVFTCMRSGLWMTGSGGSGILIARKSDGTWSPPSGILLHTPTLSFIIGVDIYDCVLVISNLAALESMTRPRVTLGDHVGLTNGPSAALGSDEADFKGTKEIGNAVLAYIKARGRYQAVNLHGCILTERANENERFYRANVSHMDILAGNVARHVDETRPLFEVIKLAEGRTDYDDAAVARAGAEPAPGDAFIATPGSTPVSPRAIFGVPKPGDPDPFGVLALEMAGLEIREAGTRLRPASSQFEYNPTPLSPACSKLNRQSVETFATRSNRASVMSSRTVRSQVTDAYTQTDAANTPETTPSPGQSDDGHAIDRMPELKEHDEVDYTRVDVAPLRHLGNEHSIGAILAADAAAAARAAAADAPEAGRGTAAAAAATAATAAAADDDDDLDDDDEEPVVFEVAAVQPTRTQAIASRVIHAKGNVVTIPKRAPPPLPQRSPARNSRCSKSDMAVKSPLRQAFGEADLRADEAGDEAAPDADEDAAKGGAEDAPAEDAPADKTPTTGDDESSLPPAPKPAERASHLETEQPAEPGVAGEPSVEAVAASAADAGTETERPAADAGTETERSAADAGTETDGSAADEAGRDDYDARHQAQHDPAEHSDSTSNKRHTSSIYTGATEDRWSCDGSSLTTPTSERPLSIAEESTEEETPKRPAKEADEGQSHDRRQPVAERTVTVA